MTDHDDDLGGKAADFLTALNEGDLETAITCLRKLDHLDRAQIEQLSDILDDDIELALFHPFTVRLVRRIRGRPQDKHRQRAKDTVTAVQVKRLTMEMGKRDAAINEVAKLQNRSESAIKQSIRRSSRKSGKSLIK